MRERLAMKEGLTVWGRTVWGAALGVAVACATVAAPLPALRQLGPAAPKGKAITPPTEDEVKAFITRFEDAKRKETTTFAVRVLAESAHNFPDLATFVKAKKIPYHLYVDLESPNITRLLNERATVAIVEQDSYGRSNVVARFEKPLRNLVYIPPQPIHAAYSRTVTGYS